MTNDWVKVPGPALALSLTTVSVRKPLFWAPISQCIEWDVNDRRSAGHRLGINNPEGFKNTQQTLLCS